MNANNYRSDTQESGKPICERKVVGKKIIPQQYIPARVIEAHEEEIVEWECRPILAARKATAEVPIQLPPPQLQLEESDIPF